MGASDSSLLGRVAVAAKLISMEQLAEATREQARRAPHQNLGYILVELGHLTPAGLQRAIALQRSVVERARRGREAGAQPAPEPTATGSPLAQPMARRARRCWGTVRLEGCAVTSSNRSPERSRTLNRTMDTADEVLRPQAWLGRQPGQGFLDDNSAPSTTKTAFLSALEEEVLSVVSGAPTVAVLTGALDSEP